ncbi:MAG TPA: hypothetical protein VIX17_18310 [Pyrinomonadaceae bacterium]|jgi:uncharacterized iron-regulated membrane protein
MRTRTTHRVIGIILLIPFVGWAITGLVFFLKPGYTGAYEALTPKVYPINNQVLISENPNWLEVRYLRTILGDHLLVRTESGWMNLNPSDKRPRSAATDDETRRFVQDAFSMNPGRYGQIVTVNGNTVTTDTGVVVTIDWNRMSLQQTGKDTKWIDSLYRIHYLQWTGIKTVDRVVGLTGITLVLVLTGLGASLAFRRK